MPDGRTELCVRKAVMTCAVGMAGPGSGSAQPGHIPWRAALLPRDELSKGWASRGSRGPTRSLTCGSDAASPRAFLLSRRLRRRSEKKYARNAHGMRTARVRLAASCVATPDPGSRPSVAPQARGASQPISRSFRGGGGALEPASRRAQNPGRPSFTHEIRTGFWNLEVPLEEGQCVFRE